MQDILKYKGEYCFEWLDAQGRKTGRKETYKNVLTQGFFDALFDALSGNTHDLEITAMATGTGTNAAMKADIALQTQVFSKGLSSSSTTSTKYIAKMLLATTESNVIIREIGVFASSVLFSRCNVNIEKTAAIQLLITYTLTLE